MIAAETRNCSFTNFFKIYDTYNKLINSVKEKKLLGANNVIISFNIYFIVKKRTV